MRHRQHLVRDRGTNIKKNNFRLTHKTIIQIYAINSNKAINAMKTGNHVM